MNEFLVLRRRQIALLHINPADAGFCIESSQNDYFIARPCVDANPVVLDTKMHDSNVDDEQGKTKQKYRFTLRRKSESIEVFLVNCIVIVAVMYK